MRRARDWSWKSRSRACSARPGTNPGWRCGFRASTGCGGTSRLAKPIGWSDWRRCWRRLKPGARRDRTALSGTCSRQTSARPHQRSAGASRDRERRLYRRSSVAAKLAPLPRFAKRFADRRRARRQACRLCLGALSAALRHRPALFHRGGPPCRRPWPWTASPGGSRERGAPASSPGDAPRSSRAQYPRDCALRKIGLSAVRSASRLL